MAELLCFGRERNDVPTAQGIQVVSPMKHHGAAFAEVFCTIVCSAHRVLLLMTGRALHPRNTAVVRTTNHRRIMRNARVALRRGIELPLAQGLELEARLRDVLVATA